MSFKKLFPALLLLGCSQLLSATEPLPVMVPTPRASVVASKVGSQPFLAMARSQQPLDLALRGYVEKELLVRGFGNAYEWAASGSKGTVAVRAANLPYVSRILVRRPLDAGKFSGRVIVELLNASAQYESAPLWGFSWEHFVRRGDAWVGVTLSPVAAATLRKFNNARYATLNLDAGQAVSCEKPRLGRSALAWDVIAQVGALLRSSSKENPLLDLNPRQLLAAGYSEGGESVHAFAVALHRELRLGDGAPIFDGYLNVSGRATAAINPCAAEPAEADARLATMPRDVPFVSVLTELDIRAPAASYIREAQGEDFRLYEVAGIDGAKPLAAGAPAVADLTAAGFAVQPGTSCREPLMDVMLAQTLNAVWQQFDDRIVQQLPMANLPRIDPAAGGASGGWRLPQLELPLAGRRPGPAGAKPASAQPATPANARPACDATTGSTPRFDAVTLKQMYRSRAEYLRRFNAAVGEALKNRLLVKEDADALKAAALRNTPAF